MKSLFISFILLSVSFHTFAQSFDTLTTKRVFITTEVYRNGFKLSHSKVKDLFKDTWQPRVKYTWGYYMNPVAPIITVAGVGLAAIALKGKDATTVAEGKVVNYKIRSLPKLLAGLALAAGGICIMESSNELVQHSVDIYNARQNNLRNRTSFIQKVDIGITDNGNLGLTLRF